MNAKYLYTLASAAFLLALATLTGCERPPVDAVQRGYRGLGMVEMFNPRTTAGQLAANKIPEAVPAAAPGGELATAVYKNVQVLTDLNVGQFTRAMVAMTNWVAPKEGCAYCHQGADFASDALYTKVVARRMLQMTRHINSDWKSHVADTGVTCYTCHRGQPVPANVWFKDPGPAQAHGSNAGSAGQNIAAPAVGLTSLPYDPLSMFIDQGNGIRVVSNTALPAGNHHSIKQTEGTYGLMMHMSQALGVNCTYCHNTRSFFSWDASTPQRATAWHGIRLARDLNVAYLNPLSTAFPANRKGPLGDVPKVNCATCHNGAYKPLLGASMAKDYPEFVGTSHAAPAAAAAPAAPVAAEPAAASANLGGLLGKVFFETGKVDISADGQQVIAAAAKQLTVNPAWIANLSGFADKTGNPEQNLELGKQRALAVRDALKSAGVAEDHINLKKPEFVIGGASAESRRVDISVEQK
jgi:photosynthetic reaction center cytochrome c subunit